MPGAVEAGHPEHVPKPHFEQAVLERLENRLREQNRLLANTQELVRDLRDLVHALSSGVHKLNVSIETLVKKIEKPRSSRG